MRITNDCTPEEMLAELLCRTGSNSKKTAGFNDSYWSSHKNVCFELSLRIEVMLQSYERLGNEVHITQSMRDNGVDILLEFTDEDSSSRRIGIQIKGNREAIDALDQKNRIDTMESILKRQAFEATRWRLSGWWVIPCFDLTQKGHSSLYDRISSELMQSNLLHPIRLFKPAQAWHFLNMSDEEIDAACVLKLCKDDPVLIAAQDETQKLTTGAKSFVISTLFDCLEENNALSLDDLIGLTEIDNNSDIEKTQKIVDELEYCGYLKRRAHEDLWSVNVSVFPGLCALYFDGRVRHKLSEIAAINFVSELV